MEYFDAKTVLRNAACGAFFEVVIDFKCIIWDEYEGDDVLLYSMGAWVATDVPADGVPEPGIIFLLGISLTGLMVIRRQAYSTLVTSDIAQRGGR